MDQTDMEVCPRRLWMLVVPRSDSLSEWAEKDAWDEERLQNTTGFDDRAKVNCLKGVRPDDERREIDTARANTVSTPQ